MFLLSCIICTYVLYYFNVVRWGWWDWELFRCFNTGGWVIWPAEKYCIRNNLSYIDWVVKLYSTRQPPPISLSMICSRVFLVLLFYVLHSANARETDVKRILTTSPWGNWRRPLGRPCTAWMKTIQQDLKSINLSLNEAIDVAQNRPLWRLMSMLLCYTLLDCTAWLIHYCWSVDTEAWWYQAGLDASVCRRLWLQTLLVWLPHRATFTLASLKCRQSGRRYAVSCLNSILYITALDSL